MALAKPPSFDWCQLCDEQQVVNFCKSCARVLCKTCTKVHIKATDTCKDDHVLELANLKEQQQHDLKSIDARIAASKVKAEENGASKLSVYEQEKANVTMKCLEAKEEIIKQLEEHFDEQKKRIGVITKDRSKKVQETIASTSEELGKLLTEVASLKEQNFLDLAITWEEIKCKLLKKLDVLEKMSDDTGPDDSKIEVGNTDLNALAFDPSKAFFIPPENLNEDEERKANATKQSSASFELMAADEKSKTKEKKQINLATYEWMTKGPLKLVHQTEIYGIVNSMQICKGRLWCLMPDHIKICDMQGNTVQVIEDVQEGLNMAAVMDEYIVVLCKTNFQVFRHNGEKLKTYGLPTEPEKHTQRVLCSQRDLFFVISTIHRNQSYFIEIFSIFQGKVVKNSVEQFPTVFNPETAVLTKDAFLIVGSSRLSVMGIEKHKFKQISGGSLQKLLKSHLIGYRYDYVGSGRYETQEVKCNETFTSSKVCDTDGEKPLIIGKYYQPLTLADVLSTDGQKKLFFGEDYRPRITVKEHSDGKPNISKEDCKRIITEELSIHKDIVALDPDMKEGINLPSDEIQGMTWVTCDNANKKIYVAVKQAFMEPSIIKIFGY